MENYRPLVSIGLPVYNGAPYVEDAIKSILTQTYSDYEIIISDNASTDRTEEICRAYATKDCRIHYYRHEKNFGAARNFNYVFKLSRGKYFKWAAYDDICAPTYLEKCIEVLEHQSSVVLCCSRAQFIDQRGQQVQLQPSCNLSILSPLPHQRLRQFFKVSAQDYPTQVFGVMRKSSLEITSLIGNYAISDRVLLEELALMGEFYEIPEPLFYRGLYPKESSCVNPTWWNPQNSGNMFYSRRYVVEYFLAVNRIPINWYEKVTCYSSIVQHFITAVLTRMRDKVS